MAGYEEQKETLATLDASIVCASVDPLEKAQQIAATVSFPVGFGLTRATADRLGAWWEDRRQFMQPAEFILGPDDKILASSYSDGPLGRMDAADVVKLVTLYRSR